MKLGEFITKFSHNNIVRLLYEIEGGHQIVGNDWDDVSMDHEIVAKKGIFRHYVNNEVLGLASISFNYKDFPFSNKSNFHEAINIVIEKLENQLFIEEVNGLKTNYSSNNYLP